MKEPAYPPPSSQADRDEPDRLTLERARRGEAAAVAAVLRGVQDRLWRLCRGLCDDEEVAREALQETAVRILARLPQFAGRSRFTTWASGIAVNVCRELRRKRPEGHAFAEAAGSESKGPDAEDLARLHAALAALPQRQREATVLRYLEGLDVKQTAELMGCAEGTVKAAVHAGLRNLRAALGEA